MKYATSTLRAGLFLIERVSGWVLLLLWLIEIPVFNAKSVDPDQTPRSAASDLDQHRLPMPLLLDTRRKWVKAYTVCHLFKGV